MDEQTDLGEVSDRVRVIDAAVAQMTDANDEGEFAFGPINLREACFAADAPETNAFRAFGSARNFHRELALRLLDESRMATPGVTRELALRILEAGGTAADVFRVAGTLDVLLIADSPTFAAFLHLVPLRSDAGMHDVLLRYLNSNLETWETLIRWLLAVEGRRLNSGVSFRDITWCVDAIARGAALRYDYMPQTPIPFEGNEWPVAGLAAWHVFIGMTHATAARKAEASRLSPDVEQRIIGDLRAVAASHREQTYLAPPTELPGRTKPEELRQAVLHAGEQLFRETMAKRAATGNIARLAGVSTSSVGKRMGVSEATVRRWLGATCAHEVPALQAPEDAEKKASASETLRRTTMLALLSNDPGQRGYAGPTTQAFEKLLDRAERGAGKIGLKECLSEGSNAVLVARQQDVEWALALQFWPYARHDREIANLVMHAYSREAKFISRLYDEAMRKRGLEFIDKDVNCEHLAHSVGALTEGMSIRALLDKKLSNHRITTDDDDHDWSPLGLGTYAILQGYTRAVDESPA